MRHLARFALLLAACFVPSLAAAEPADDPLSGLPVAAKSSRASTRASNLSRASALVPDFTWGLSLPVSRFGYSRNADGSYGGNVVAIQPGVGASLYWNVVKGPSGSVPVAIGTTLFGATDLSSQQSDAGLGIALGPSFFNNTFGVMVGVDLYRRIGDRDRGLLMVGAGGGSGFARDNVFLLFNFGIGLGKSAPGALKIAP